jgi:hypothetical protein
MDQEAPAEQQTKIQAYSVGELVNLYSVTYHTFKTWLKPHLESIGERQGTFYTPKQVKKIFSKLGNPTE